MHASNIHKNKCFTQHRNDQHFYFEKTHTKQQQNLMLTISKIHSNARASFHYQVHSGNSLTCITDKIDFDLLILLHV